MPAPARAGEAGYAGESLCPNDPSACPLRKAMQVVGGKWRMLLLEKLRPGVKRYGELKRMMPDISEKMLIQELKHLVESGLVEKRAYPEIPPRVEYTLTDHGRGALPMIDGIVAFGLVQMRAEQTLRPRRGAARTRPVD